MDEQREYNPSPGGGLHEAVSNYQPSPIPLPLPSSPSLTLSPPVHSQTFASSDHSSNFHQTNDCDIDIGADNIGKPECSSSGNSGIAGISGSGSEFQQRHSDGDRLHSFRSRFLSTFSASSLGKGTWPPSSSMSAGTDTGTSSFYSRSAEGSASTANDSAYPAGKAIHAAFVLKRSARSGLWQRRWHELHIVEDKAGGGDGGKSGRMCWWKFERFGSSTSPSTSAPPATGSAPELVVVNNMLGCIEVNVGTALYHEHDKTTFSLQASKRNQPKTYRWKAASMSDKHAWLEALIDAGAKAPPNFTRGEYPEYTPPPTPLQALNTDLTKIAVKATASTQSLINRASVALRRDTLAQGEASTRSGFSSLRMSGDHSPPSGGGGGDIPESGKTRRRLGTIASRARQSRIASHFFKESPISSSAPEFSEHSLAERNPTLSHVAAASNPPLTRSTSDSWPLMHAIEKGEEAGENPSAEVLEGIPTDAPGNVDVLKQPTRSLSSPTLSMNIISKSSPPSPKLTHHQPQLPASPPAAVSKFSDPARPPPALRRPVPPSTLLPRTPEQQRTQLDKLMVVAPELCAVAMAMDSKTDSTASSIASTTTSSSASLASPNFQQPEVENALDSSTAGTEPHHLTTDCLTEPVSPSRPKARPKFGRPG